jgi:DNA-binding CsgD family transcriptional regulator
MKISNDIKHIILFGLSLAVLVFLLKWLQWKFLIVDNAIDIYIGLIAVFFTILGIWISSQIAKSGIQTVVVEKAIVVKEPKTFEVNQTALEKLDLSNREFEVLEYMSQGYSNAEIAEKLFLSVSTIKTHVSNLYDKMDVKSRTQAINKAKRLQIIE